MREDCLTQLQGANVTAARVFLVSSFHRSDYDFPELETTLLRELPAHKRHIFMMCLPNVTEAAIDQKRDSLKQKVWLEALRAGATALIPLVGLISDSDIEKLEETLTLYRSYFGLDDKSLEKMAQDLGVSVNDLKANLKSPYLLSAESGESVGEKIRQYIEKALLVTGGPIAASLYLRRTFYVQNHFLETVASDAKALLKKENLFGNPLGPKEGHRN